MTSFRPQLEQLEDRLVPTTILAQLRPLLHLGKELVGRIGPLNTSNVLDRIAGQFNYGNWGGLYRAPADNLVFGKTPLNYSELENWAKGFIQAGRLPAPKDAVDRTFMLHDLRMKWLKDHALGGQNLDWKTRDARVVWVHKELVKDLKQVLQANPTLTSQARTIATSAASAFQALVQYLR